MILVYIVGIVFLLLLAAIFFGRFFAWLVEIFAQFFFHIDLKVDTLGLFAANGIEIKFKNGFKVGIEKICLHCKWTLNDSKRLFTVLLRSVVIEVRKGNVDTNLHQHLDQPANSRSSNKFVTAHRKTIKRLLRKCCQYIGIQVSSVEVLLGSKHHPGSLTQCILPDGLQLYAKTVNDYLSSTLVINKIGTQLFKTIKDKSAKVLDPCAEISCSLIMEISLIPFESIQSMTASVHVNNVDVLLSEGLLGDKQSKAVIIHKDNKRNISTVLKPMTLIEIQENISCLPKSVDLAVDVISVTFLNKEKRKLVLEVKQIVSHLHSHERSNESSQDCNRCDLGVQITGVNVKNTHSYKLCEWSRLRLTSKLSCHYGTIALASMLYIESVHYTHVQEEFSYWLEYYKSRRKNLKMTDASEVAYVDEESKLSILSKLPAELEVTNSVEVTDCSTSMFISHPHQNEQGLCRAVLTSLTGDMKISAQDIHHVNTGRELSTSLTLENSYLYMDTSHSLLIEGSTINAVSSTLQDHTSLLPSSSKHVWGRVLALGSCNVKLSTELMEGTEIPPSIRVTGEASSLVVEWSHDVCRFLLKWFKPSPLKSFKEPGNRTTTAKSIAALDMDFRVSGVNLFYLGRLDEGVDSFMTRIDMAVMTATSIPDWTINSEIYGMKLCRLSRLEKVPYKCGISAELENDLISIPVATVSHSGYKACLISVKEVLISWDPTVHMAIHDRITEVTQDGAELKAMLKTTTVSSSDNDSSSHKGSKPLDLTCNISWFKLQMQTSAKTSFGVECKSCSLSLESNSLDVKSEYAGLLFDDLCIFKLETISIKRLAQVEEVLRVRQQFKQLETQSNTTWIIQVEMMQVCFPFLFNFAASRDELVNVFKMLKSLHKKPKDESYKEPLPPDLWIHFENIAFEMEDDPFEVKLRDNYALLLDEMEQWNERQQLLAAKLDEIRKRPGNLLTVKKEEELKRSLEEKNSQIYIRRSQTLYDQTPMRTTLLMWEFQGLDLIVLADESYHDQEKATEVMKQLNSDSPYPASGLKFTTLWCRTVQGKLQSHKCCLRDFPEAIFTSQSVELKGTLLGAEQKPADRAKREAVVEIGKPWSNITISRSLSSLKYFYDLKFDMDTMEMAWGVDIEPVLAMVSLAFENLSSPSRDASKPLPFFDKMRLLYHGHLHLAINEWYLYFSASKNPYDTTERMQWEWRQAKFDWTNGRIVIEGDFDLHTRAASKYDDRRVLHLPAMKLSTNMKWHCQGDPNDHHSVVQCAPDKIPQLAPNQAHDSYAAFRSQNLTLDISLETGLSSKKDYSQSDPPTLFMYASTFRWFQKYQAVVLWYVSRPTKRGTYFGRERVKKRSLGRHYREVSLSLQFPEFSVWYWGSFTQQRGFELSLGSGYLETTYSLSLREYSDGLKRRPAADWIAAKLRSELLDVTCHLYGLEEVDGKESSDEYAEVSSIDLEPTKYYLLAAARLEYTRQDTSKKQETFVDGPSPELQNYNHRLVCHDLKGAWTPTNRRIAFGLFEAYTNAQVLKKILSADALKFTIVDKKGKQDDEKGSLNSSVKARSASVTNMLEKLVMEKEIKFVAFAEEGTGEHEQVTEAHLHGVALCTANDVVEDKWHIALVNSQIVLKGIESEGCVLVAAGNTRILNRLHTPVWSKGELFNKKTWVGNVENLQYFATVGAEDTIGLESTPWLSTSVITGRLDKNSFDIADLANIVGSGEAVGGMVNAVVGSGAGQEPTQLQRIVARCSCDFYFVNFSPDLDPVAEEHAHEIVPPSPSSHLREDRHVAVNTFTIRHKLLEISTNSAQYAMLIDIAHNVVLYTEPKKKEAFDRLQRMRFQLRLSTSEDQRAQILRLQNTVRSHHTEMRRLERELYEVNLLRKQAIDDQELTDAVIQLEREIMQQKEKLSSSSSELRIMISAYKDFLMNLNTPTPERAPTAEVIKLAEVYFNHASWQLNQEDGQLAIADTSFTNFSYRKTTLSGATVEHRLELGRFHVRNLLPNSIYKDVMSPLDLSGKGHVDRAVAVRVFSRVRPPVGGIGVKEHFEVNVCPLAVRLTKRLFKKVMVFFFPQRAYEYEGEVGEVDLGFRGMEVEDKDVFSYDDEELLGPPPSLKSTSLRRSASSVSAASSESSIDSFRHKKSSMTVTDSPPLSPLVKEKAAKKKSTFYKRISDYDDLDKMKERASKNNSFIYVKIPEVSLLVSYKGEKDRNIIDVHDFSLVIPTLEYHNRTWTWHDLLMAMKKDCVNVLLSQAIKEKLHLVGGHGTETKESKSQAKEEDKARMLLGGFQQKDPQKKTKKKLLSKFVKVARGSKRKGLLQPDGAGPEPVDLEEDQDFEEYGTFENDDQLKDEERKDDTI
ncbi:bridge-like lipid transfer protein family member 2 isoform X2 [Oculina patagonica]